MLRIYRRFRTECYADMCVAKWPYDDEQLRYSATPKLEVTPNLIITEYI
ncbi:MAG: hypothetical protein AAGJ08_23125 [Cyanobacteria bacterium P01_H01_bin.35]